LQDAKDCFGLDGHQIREWTSVRRWIILALLAACATAIAHHRARGLGSRLTLTGLARPYDEISRTVHPEDLHHHCSEWICGHNEQARRFHCQRRCDHRTSGGHDLPPPY
jgi:hypothetical protein